MNQPEAVETTSDIRDTPSSLDLERLYELMVEASKALDKDTYEQKRQDDFDTPDDGEWWIRAGTARKCDKVFAEVGRIRRALRTKVLGE